MLIRFNNYEELDTDKLMTIYAESNYENIDYFYPNESNKELALKKVEAGFKTFLKEEFFKNNDSTYFIYEDKGIWVSALRLNKIKDDLYYLEALETRPDKRRMGYGQKLIFNVIDELKKEGSFKICDCVSKRNIPSIKVHEQCGFKIVSNEGYDYLQKEYNDHDYGFEYSYK